MDQRSESNEEVVVAMYVANMASYRLPSFLLGSSSPWMEEPLVLVLAS